MKAGSRWRAVQPAPDTPVWLRPGPVAALLGALALLIYLNSLGNGFVFDDRPLIAQNFRIRQISSIPRILGITGRRAYRPIRTAMHAVEYFFFGPNPTGYRAVNIALHSLNATLLFLLFRRLLGRPRPALLAAILFVVHPIQTESVAYISGRRDILFTLFFLAGLTAYVRYRETERTRYLILTGGAYALSVFSKEMGITLPVLCLCYDVVRATPTQTEKSPSTPWQAAIEGIQTAVRRHKVLYAAGAAVLLFAVWYFAVHKNPSFHKKLYGGGLWPTLLTSARITVHYMKLLVLPTTLNADYSYNAFPISYSLMDVRVVFALLVLGGAWWFIYRLLPRERWAAFGGLWFFITLLPVSQIIPHHEMVAEHYLYLPSAGVFLAAAVLIEPLLVTRRYQVAAAAGFALIVALLGLRTIVRNRDWRDSETLWSKTVLTAPGSARAHINVGEIALRKRQPQQAFRHFSEAVRIQPDSDINRDNLGIVLLRHGLFDDAEAQFREAMRIRPANPKPRMNLGLLYLHAARLDEAEQQFRDALEAVKRRRRKITKGFKASIHNNLGIVLALQGKRDEAERSFKEALRRSPTFADARANLGKAYVERGRFDEGIAELEAAIRLKKSDPRFHYMLGQAYYRRGEKELASVQLAKALSLKPDFPEARALLEKIGNESASERGRRG
jgi:Flp pilus assembly protein TadD